MAKISCKNVFKNGKEPNKEMFNKKIAELMRTGKGCRVKNYDRV